MSPVNHKGLHRGWTQTSLYHQVIHFTIHHTTSHDFFVVAYLYSAGTHHGNLHPAGYQFYSAGLHRKHVLAIANTGTIGRDFGKNAGEWAASVEISNEEKSLTVSVACMAIYWPTPGFKRRTFKLCVLTRWDFNFCVRSPLLRGLVFRSCWKVYRVFTISLFGCFWSLLPSPSVNHTAVGYSGCRLESPVCWETKTVKRDGCTINSTQEFWSQLNSNLWPVNITLLLRHAWRFLVNNRVSVPETWRRLR